MASTVRSAAHPARDHAVVIGAGVAGLLAARALSDTHMRVTVVDRDTLPGTPAPRRGVPQSRHLHVLLARGALALDELFPGFLDELTAAGASVGDTQADAHWYLDGFLVRRAPSGLIAYGASRALVEYLVRARVAALDGVEIVDSTEVLGLTTTRDRQRITGVRLLSHNADDADDAGGAGQPEESTLAADLVVDASGRGSRALTWLRDLGHPSPARSRVRADVVYVTRRFRREPHHLDGRVGAAIVPFPGTPRGAAVLTEEDDRFAVVLIGLLGEEPPTDDEGMLAYAESLAGPDVAEVLRTAEPLDEAVRMRFPASVRHHYEKLGRHLDGLLVMGDALCCFNPTYGQGMTTAAQEALLLRKLLAEGTADLPRRFFRAAARIVDTPWLLAAGGDLRFPEAEGKRGPADGLLDRYLGRYRAAASVDPVLGTAFLSVAHMVEPPTTLLSPRHALRVLRASGKAAPRAGTDRPPIPTATPDHS